MLFRSHDDAEDAVQDILCKLWMLREKLDHYRSVDALAATAVRNYCLNHLRRSVQEVPIDERSVSIPDTEPDADAAQEERLDTILQLMKELPDTQQAVLRMKHIDGLETDEIARTLGCTEEAVRMNLSRARKRIKEQFFRNKPNEV